MISKLSNNVIVFLGYLNDSSKKDDILHVKLLISCSKKLSSSIHKILTECESSIGISSTSVSMSYGSSILDQPSFQAMRSFFNDAYFILGIFECLLWFPNFHDFIGYHECYWANKLRSLNKMIIDQKKIPYNSLSGAGKEEKDLAKNENQENDNFSTLCVDDKVEDNLSQFDSLLDAITILQKNIYLFLNNCVLAFQCGPLLNALFKNINKYIKNSNDINAIGISTEENGPIQIPLGEEKDYDDVLFLVLIALTETLNIYDHPSTSKIGNLIRLFIKFRPFHEVFLSTSKLCPSIEKIRNNSKAKNNLKRKMKSRKPSLAFHISPNSNTLFYTILGQLFKASYLTSVVNASETCQCLQTLFISNKPLMTSLILYHFEGFVSAIVSLIRPPYNEIEDQVFEDTDEDEGEEDKDYADTNYSSNVISTEGDKGNCQNISKFDSTCDISNKKKYLCKRKMKSYSFLRCSDSWYVRARFLLKLLSLCLGDISFGKARTKLADSPALLASILKVVAVLPERIPSYVTSSFSLGYALSSGDNNKDNNSVSGAEFSLKPSKDTINDKNVFSLGFPKFQSQDVLLHYECYHVLKVFIAKPKKNICISFLLTSNRDSLLKFLKDYKTLNKDCLTQSSTLDEAIDEEIRLLSEKLCSIPLLTLEEELELKYFILNQ